MNYCVYGASSDTIHPDYLAGAEELGRCLARHGHGLVFGAGNHGMMGAAARGVTEIRKMLQDKLPPQTGQSPDEEPSLQTRQTKQALPEIIGISPRFFNEDGILYSGCTTMIFTDTMRERKQKMEELSAGFIITPGGLGTLDEFFEIATLRQLGQHGKPVAILNIRGYYNDLQRLLARSVEEHFVCEATLELLHFFEDPEELVCWIESQKEFLMDWHEMKYKDNTAGEAKA